MPDNSEKKNQFSSRLFGYADDNIPVSNLLFAGYISETMKLGASLPAYRTYALEELKEATNNFHASFVIGESTSGQVWLNLK